MVAEGPGVSEARKAIEICLKYVYVYMHGYAGVPGGQKRVSEPRSWSCRHFPYELPSVGIGN